MMGNVLTMAERVDDEFTKLLQHTDAHSTDYVTKYVCMQIRTWYIPVLCKDHLVS